VCSPPVNLSGIKHQVLSTKLKSKTHKRPNPVKDSAFDVYGVAVARSLHPPAYLKAVRLDAAVKEISLTTVECGACCCAAGFVVTGYRRVCRSIPHQYRPAPCIEGMLSQKKPPPNG